MIPIHNQRPYQVLPQGDLPSQIKSIKHRSTSILANCTYQTDCTLSVLVLLFLLRAQYFMPGTIDGVDSGYLSGCLITCSVFMMLKPSRYVEGALGDV